MKAVSANATKRFSKALGQLHNAPSAEVLDQSVARVIKTLFPGLSTAEREAWTSQLCDSRFLDDGSAGAALAKRPFLLELLQTHVLQCRNRMVGSPFLPPRPSLAARPNEKGLTPRELEVLERMTLGETDLEISKVLGIKPKTVSKHVEHILDKFGVETRTAVAIQTLSRGS